jgi:drug/metabolite transporter (DMT)-like permease
MLVFTMLLWSGNLVMGRGLRDLLSPVSLSFWRWSLTALFILPFAWPHLRRQWPMMLRHWRILLLLSMLMVSVGNTLVYVALEQTTAINVSLVNAVQPVVMILAAWLLDRDTVTRLQGVGIALSLTGVLLVISRADLTAILTLRFNQGDYWMFVAVVCFALYAVIHRRAPRGLHPLVLLQAVTGLGALGIVPIYLAEWAAGETRLTITVGTVAAMLYVSLLASFISILFWNRALADIGSQRAGVFLYLLPVFSSVLSILVLDEPVGLYHLVGFAFIVVGIYVTTRLGAPRGNQF